MKVLVAVEDDQDMRTLIKLRLGVDPRLEIVGEAATATEAIALVGKVHPDVVILDHFIYGDVMGLEAAPMLKQASPESKILLFTDHDLAAEASREPAIDGYLNKRRLSDLLATVQMLAGLQPATGRHG